MKTLESFELPVLDLLPEELQKAQLAMYEPEVQEMLKKLSEYNLGICMPHKHNEADGSFMVLPADEVQVEDDLNVSFSKREDLPKKKMVEVGWFWKEGAATISSMCTTTCVMDNDMHKNGHASQG